MALNEGEGDMRQMIAALQVSVDGLIEGPGGEVDWIGAWDDSFDLLGQIDTCVLGGRTYAGYEQYWRAILADREGVLPLTGKVASEAEVAYARFADRTPHLVVSTTLEDVTWGTARIVRDVDEIRRVKQQPGKDIYVVGGAALVSSLMNLGMIDELRLTVHPLLLGRGTALFKDVTDRHALTLVLAEPRTGSGKLSLVYRI
jgi:dihydrofolate reductase